MVNPNEHVIDRVDEFVHQLLAPAEVLRVERHCEACPACREALEGARKRLAALKALPASEPSEAHLQKTLAGIDAYERRGRRLKKWLLGGGLAATAAAVAILLVFHLRYENLTVTPYDLKV